MFCFIMCNNVQQCAIMCLVEEVSNAHVSVVYIILENTIVRTSYPSFLVRFKYETKKYDYYYALSIIKSY